MTTFNVLTICKVEKYNISLSDSDINTEGIKSNS